MGLKINGSNITQMKINGYDTKLAKINGNIVFQKMILIKTFYGAYKQATTTGKNLFDNNNNLTNVFLNASTGTTLSSNEWCTTGYIQVEPNEIYTFGWESSISYFQVNTCYYDADKNFISGESVTSYAYSKMFTIPENATYIRLGYSTNVSGNPVTRTNIMFVKGEYTSYSAMLPYEPYTGGIPSPNPDYPQEIQTIVGASLKLTGKNLFDYNYYFENYVNNGSQYSIYPCVLTLKPDISYTVSTNKDNDGFANIFAWSGSDITVSPGTTSNGVLSNSPRTITTDSNGKLVLSIRNIDTTSKDSFENGTIWVQIEEGTTATEYEIYKPQSIPTDLKGYVLAKVGDIADELKIYSNGDVSILKNIDKISNYNGETISTDYLSTTGELTTGATIYYVNNEPQTIALDNIKTQLDSFGTYSSMELVVTYG